MGEVLFTPFSILKFSGIHIGGVAGAVSYLADGGLSASLLATAQDVPFPARTLRNLRVKASSNPLAAALVVTVYKNGSATSLTATITTASTALFTDITNSVVFTSGDLFDLRLDSTAAGVATALLSATIEVH